MRPDYRRHHPIDATCALLLALSGLLLLATSALAHGGGTPRLTDADAGPYRIFAWTEPEPWRAGEVHVSVMVTLAPPPGTEEDERAAANRLDQAVNDAAVVVTLSPVDVDGEPLRLPAERQALGSNVSYEVDADLPEAGIWQVEISVEGSAGTGEASFETNVLPSRVVNVWILVGGALSIVAIVGIIGLRRR